MHETFGNDLPFWLLLARLYLAAMFLRAGIVKIVNPTGFQSSLAEYKLLPLRLESTVARALPVIEICAGSLLAIGIAVRLAASVISVLLVAFSAAMAFNLARGRAVDCGCAGGASVPITWPHVMLNLGLAAVAVLVAFGAFTAAWIWLEWRNVLPAAIVLVTTAVAWSLGKHGLLALQAARR